MSKSPKPSGQSSGCTNLRWALLPLVLAIAILPELAGCAPKPLPERGSPAEQLYANRCGGCHRAYLPSTMTTAMWAEQVEAMQLKMAQAGERPLSEAERREVLEYLKRNAGDE
jgi:Dihaem cytochrome c